MRLLASVGLALALAAVACDRPASEKPETHADAVARGAIERGWLPALIPRSSNRVRYVIDKADGSGNGVFHYDGKELNAFVGHLTKAPGSVRHAGLFGQPTLFQEYRHEDWVFLVEPDAHYCLFYFRTDPKYQSSEPQR